MTAYSTNKKAVPLAGHSLLNVYSLNFIDSLRKRFISTRSHRFDI